MTESAQVVDPAGSSVGASGAVDQAPEIKNPEALLANYRKLLEEKKSAQSQLDELLKEKEEKQRKDLEKRGEYQKLLEIERKRADDALGKLSQVEAQRAEAKKMRAILRALDNGLDEKYFGFLPTDSVAIDPDTGEVNETSVVQAAEAFKKQYPEILRPKAGVKMPSDAPKGNAADTISHDAWLKLPLKEMKKWMPNQIIK